MRCALALLNGRQTLRARDQPHRYSQELHYCLILAVPRPVAAAGLMKRGGGGPCQDPRMRPSRTVAVPWRFKKHHNDTET